MTRGSICRARRRFASLLLPIPVATSTFGGDVQPRSINAIAARHPGARIAAYDASFEASACRDALRDKNHARLFPCRFPAIAMAGKILSLPAAKSFPADGAVVFWPSTGNQKNSRPKARSMFSPTSIFFPYFPVRQGKTARRAGRSSARRCQKRVGRQAARPRRRPRSSRRGRRGPSPLRQRGCGKALATGTRSTRPRWTSA